MTKNSSKKASDLGSNPSVPILLKKEDVRFLKSYKVSVGISLDSFDMNTNDRTRKAGARGNFKKAVQAIEWFNGYEGLNVITTITKHNVRHLAGLVRALHKRKVPCVLLNPVRVTRRPVMKHRGSR